MNIKEFLDERRIAYKVYSHEATYDAPHTAAALRVPGSNVAKTVLIGANSGYRHFVVVLPAMAHIDFTRISHALGGAEIRLATEHEISERCPDCERGILPPFGSHFATETIVDASLAQHEDLFFPGDSHEEAIRMSYQDFYNLEHPLVMDVIQRSVTTSAVIK
jgi:Ala-tRNA(Pro) deacylase